MSAALLLHAERATCTRPTMKTTETIWAGAVLWEARRPGGKERRHSCRLVEEKLVSQRLWLFTMGHPSSSTTIGW